MGFSGSPVARVTKLTIAEIQSKLLSAIDANAQNLVVFPKGV